MSIPQMLAERQTSKNFVAPLTDYQIGKRMFYNAISFNDCTTDEMRNGWLAAEGRTLGAIFAQGGVAASDAVAKAVWQ